MTHKAVCAVANDAWHLEESETWTPEFGVAASQAATDSARAKMMTRTMVMTLTWMTEAATKGDSRPVEDLQLVRARK